MITTEYMIKTLRGYAENHKNDFVSTFDTNVSEMCFDVADRLEELAKGRHGRWEESRCLDDCFWVCSCCKFPSQAIAAPKLYKYCPNCGARMDIVED